jgi:hypothetical protein
VHTLFDSQLEAELCRWLVWDGNIDDLTCIHASDSHLRALRHPIQVCEFRIDLDMSCECPVLVADQEDAQAKQGDTGNDKDSNGSVSIRHSVIAPR